MSDSIVLHPSDESEVTQEDHRIIPNYAKPPEQTFTDFVTYCVDTSKSLDIICRHWAPIVEVAMPSWVSLITGSAFGMPEEALGGRSNADILVVTGSELYEKSYNASARRDAVATFSPRDSRSTKGKSGNMKKPERSGSFPSFVFDTIGELSARAAEGMIYQECLKMAGWEQTSSLENVPGALWRTLVADRDPWMNTAPSWYRRAFLSCLATMRLSRDLNTSALMAHAETPSTMVTFLRRVQNVIWNRKFLISEEHKLLGLAPSSAKEGDLICVLLGCTIPVLLRQV